MYRGVLVPPSKKILHTSANFSEIWQRKRKVQGDEVFTCFLEIKCSREMCVCVFCVWGVEHSPCSTPEMGHEGLCGWGNFELILEMFGCHSIL